jgi:hypothetical protein
MSNGPNLGRLLREPFQEMTAHVHARLAEQGHPQIRVAHGNVFQFLDDEGTRASDLAARAQMTKQSMGELIAHLEAHGYVERVPDPGDGRALGGADRGAEAPPAARAARGAQRPSVTRGACVTYGSRRCAVRWRSSATARRGRRGATSTRGSVSARRLDSAAMRAAMGELNMGRSPF